MFDNFSSTDCCYLIQDNENNQFIEKNLRIYSETTRRIEEKTLGQSTDNSWFIEQKKRLTASNFGSVINRRKLIEPKSILKVLFVIEVSRTKKMHRKRKLKNVELIISPKWPWLDASLDALVDSVTVQVVEVK